MNTINKVYVMVVLAGLVIGCTVDKNQVINATEKTIPISPIGKPGAPISMSYKILTESPDPGEEIEIEVKFESRIKSAIAVKANSNNKLIWTSTEKEWSSVANKLGVRDVLPLLRVTAPEKGIFYIHLVANVVQDGKTLAKPFTIPVKIGNDPIELESVGEVVTDESGQRIIIQKAKSDN